MKKDISLKQEFVLISFLLASAILFFSFIPLEFLVGKLSHEAFYGLGLIMGMLTILYIDYCVDVLENVKKHGGLWFR